MNVSGLSHTALIVRNVDVMADFYQEFAEMHIIHRRNDEGVKVIWLRLPDPKSLTIVMIEDPNLEVGSYQRMNHFGFDAKSKEAVDRISDKAVKAGIAVYPAFDGGTVLGYMCMIKDPDGNQLEFAYGQMRVEEEII